MNRPASQVEKKRPRTDGPGRETPNSKTNLTERTQRDSNQSSRTAQAKPDPNPNPTPTTVDDTAGTQGSAGNLDDITHPDDGSKRADGDHEVGIDGRVERGAVDG